MDLANTQKLMLSLVLAIKIISYTDTKETPEYCC